MGKAGSGKDTLLKALLEEPAIAKIAVPIISCTTRPRRENEQDGINYHFITIEQFTEQVLTGKMLEATCFNNWHYGTSFDNLNPDKVNIGVFNPEGVEMLRDNSDIEVKVICMEANDKDRLLRQLNREKDPDVQEIIRRFSADEVDFREEEIEYIQPECFVTNNDGANIHKIANAIAKAYVQGQF